MELDLAIETFDLFMEALSGYFDPDIAVDRAQQVTERLRAPGGAE